MLCGIRTGSASCCRARALATASSAAAEKLSKATLISFTELHIKACRLRAGARVAKAFSNRTGSGAEVRPGTRQVPDVFAWAVLKSVKPEPKRGVGIEEVDIREHLSPMPMWHQCRVDQGRIMPGAVLTGRRELNTGPVAVKVEGLLVAQLGKILSSRQVQGRAVKITSHNARHRRRGGS